MLSIRPDQLKAIADAPQRQYIAQATQYVQTNFAGEIDRRGSEGVATLIRLAMDDGAKYGFARGHDVTGLLTLMILLGDEFAADPRYAWARDALHAKSLAPGERIKFILDEISKG